MGNGIHDEHEIDKYVGTYLLQVMTQPIVVENEAQTPLVSTSDFSKWFVFCTHADAQRLCFEVKKNPNAIRFRLGVVILSMQAARTAWIRPHHFKPLFVSLLITSAPLSRMVNSGSLSSAINGAWHGNLHTFVVHSWRYYHVICGLHQDFILMLFISLMYFLLLWLSIPSLFMICNVS